MLFSNSLIKETYSFQSTGRMEILVNKVNMIVSSCREANLRLSKNGRILSALFAPEKPEEDEISLLYQDLYKSLSGHIDDVSVHLLNQNGKRIYSTHVLPAIYNPNSSEQSLSTFLKLKNGRETFPIVDSFVNPKGNRVALSLFHQLIREDGQRGFIITDLNIEPLIEEFEVINGGFFNNIYLLDNINYKYVSLYREGDFGNYSGLGWEIPQGESGVLITDNKLIAYGSLYPEELTLAASLTLGTVTANLSILTRMILIISIVGLILSSIMAFALAKKISHPVTALVDAMKKMEKGDFTVQIEESYKDEFEILFRGFNEMSSQIQSLMNARVAREKALRTAERKALQSQINPHFLYNTLNTVKAISKLEGVDQITTIVIKLGKLLRDSIDSEEEFTTVGQSAELVEAYLYIQKIRYGDRFNWKINIDESLKSLCIPRLIIQPIVENSVVHGLEHLTGEQLITIRGEADPPHISIIDNGGTMTSEIWKTSLEGNQGVGLKNVHNRLKLYYGDSAGLTMENRGGNSVVIIHLGSEKEVEK